MFKKMVVSMLVMTVMITISVVVFLIYTERWPFDMTADKSEKTIEKSFEDDSYMYYLSDDDINDAIEVAVTSVEYLENFIIEREKDTTDGDSVAFAYVETPYLTVVKEARKTFDLFGRRPAPEEMTETLMDSYLPVHIRYNENAAFVYDVAMYQDEGESKISPVKTENSDEGTFKTIFLSVDELDFSKPLMIRTEDRLDESVYTEFRLDFEDFRP